MKKIVITLVLFSLVPVLGFADGGDDDLFSIDQQAVEAEFEALNRFEEMFLATGLSASELPAQARKMAEQAGIRLQNTTPAQALSTVPSLVYNTLCGPVGVAIHQSSPQGANSKKFDKQKLLIGAGIAIVVLGVTVVVISASNGNSSCSNAIGDACGNALGDACSSSSSEACSSTGFF